MDNPFKFLFTPAGLMAILGIFAILGITVFILSRRAKKKAAKKKAVKKVARPRRRRRIRRRRRRRPDRNCIKNIVLKFRRDIRKRCKGNSKCMIKLDRRYGKKISQKVQRKCM